jgi:ribosome-binding ATPase YchF (GTP1/OBG family)
VAPRTIGVAPRGSAWHHHGSRTIGIFAQSTLFNALTNTQAAQAANYPFCTIDPNVGRVAIPDARLDALAQVRREVRCERGNKAQARGPVPYSLAVCNATRGIIRQIGGSAKVIGAQLEFVDIAGLVRGASEGAGLGNKFLGNIRQVSMILMLLRCFDDTDTDIIEHVDGSVDPVRDLETIETELLLADMQTLTKRDASAGKKKTDSWSPATEKALISKILKQLDAGEPARDMMLAEDEVPIFRQLQVQEIRGRPWHVSCI